NRGSEPATLDVLPTVWFRNVWSWHHNPTRPSLTRAGSNTIALDDLKYGRRYLHADNVQLTPSHSTKPELLFTENETNTERICGAPNGTPYVKDAFHRFIVNGERNAVNPHGVGTKAAARYTLALAPHQSSTLQLRLTARSTVAFGDEFDAVFAARRVEAD